MTPNESAACRAAMERLAEAGWDIESEEAIEANNLALELMWKAGRDWAMAQTTATITGASVDDERERD